MVGNLRGWMDFRPHSLIRSRQRSGRVSVATNPAASVRQGDLVLNDQHIQVRQEAAACKYEIAPKSHDLDAGGDEWQVQVTAVTGAPGGQRATSPG